MWKYAICLAWLCLCLVAQPGYTQNRVIDLPITLQMEAVGSTDFVTSVSPGGTEEISVKVVTPNGNPMPGATIQFTTTGGPALRTFPNEMTDTNGVATIQFPTDTPGVFTITASAQDSEVRSGSPLTFMMTVIDVWLQSVSFDGDGHYEVIPDDSADPLEPGYEAPHWLDTNLDGDAVDSGDRQYPTVYAGATLAELAATFHLDPGPNVSSALIKAEGTGNFDLGPTPIFIDGSTATLYPAACTNLLDDTVVFYEPNGFITIDWAISFDEGQTWLAVGSNQNQVYITLDDPQDNVFGHPVLRHTTVHLSCRNANGESVKANIPDRVWSEFSDLTVTTVDGIALNYYNPWGTTNTQPSSLFASGNGQCSAWVKLFLDMLKIHGFEDAVDYQFTIIEPANANNDGLLIDNWEFELSGGSSGDLTFPFFNLLDPSIQTPGGDPVYIGENTYHWGYSEVMDETGVTGQGPTSNPVADFEDHKVVLIDGHYYDPAYGQIWDSIADLEENVAGFYKVGSLLVNEADVQLDLNEDDDQEDEGIEVENAFLIKKSVSSGDVTPLLGYY